MHAPAPPRPFVSPTNEDILLVAQQEYPSIARVATPFLRLAGVRVEPANHSKHDTPGGYGITPCASSYEVVAYCRWQDEARDAASRRVPGIAAVVGRRQAISRSRTLLRLRSSCGSATVPQVQSGKFPAWR